MTKHSVATTLRLEKWWKFVRGSRFLRGIITLVSAHGAGQLIILAATPVLTRLYTPQDFGVLAVFMAVLSVMAVGSSLRYELAIPLPKRDRDAGQLLILALGINFLVASLTVLLVWVFGASIASSLAAPALDPLLWLLPLAILATGSYKALNYWAIRRREYRRIAQTRITQALSNVVIQLLGGFAGLGALSLVLGQAIGQSAGVMRLAAGLPFGEFFKRTKRTTLRTKVLLRRYQRFPKYDVPAAIVNSVSQQLPNFLLALMFGPTVAGFYFLADRILATPMSMVSQAVSQVFYGDMRRLLETGQALRRSIQILMFMGALILIPAGALVFYAEPLFVWIFGEPWQQAGIYAGWLIVGLSAQFLYGPVSMVLMGTEGQTINLALHSGMILIKLVAITAGFVAQSPLVAIIGLSISLLTGYGLGIFVVLYRLNDRKA